MRDEPLKEAESSEAATSRIEVELLQTETREVCRAEFAVSRNIGGGI
jgi:hypothetical protein